MDPGRLSQAEGEGFLSGEAKQGYLFVFKIFLTPVILVFEFFVSLMILDMMTNIIFEGWGTMLRIVTATSFTGVVGLIALIAIFEILVIGSLKKIFVYTLLTFPRWILSWGGMQGEARTSMCPDIPRHPAKLCGWRTLPVAPSLEMSATQWLNPMPPKRNEEPRRRRRSKSPPEAERKTKESPRGAKPAVAAERAARPPPRRRRLRLKVLEPEIFRNNAETMGKGDAS